jgi:O-antigen ligase
MESRRKQHSQSLRPAFEMEVAKRRAARVPVARFHASQFVWARRWVWVFLFLVVLLACKTPALGAPAEPENPDNVVDVGLTVSAAARIAVYGLGLIVLCLVSLKIPDAPLLLLIFSMPIAEFGGLKIALALLQCGIVCIRSRSLRYFFPSWQLLLFLFWINASAIWALDPQKSFFGEVTGVLATFLQLPLVIAARALLHSNLSSIWRLLWALVLGCIPGCLLVIKNALAGIRWQNDLNDYYMGFIRPDIFSPMLVIVGVFLVACLTSRRYGIGVKIFAVVGLALCCVGILLTGIRSGWIGFGVAALPLILRQRSFVAIPGLLAVAALVGMLYWGDFGGLNLSEKISSRVASMSSGEARVSFWEVAIKGFEGRPILGIGWGGFPGFAADNGVGAEMLTHNIFIRILCELGLVGLTIFFVWIGATVWRLWHSREGSLLGWIMLGVLVQGILLDHFVGSYFWLLLGMCDGFRSFRAVCEPKRLRQQLDPLQTPHPAAA